MSEGGARVDGSALNGSIRSLPHARTLPTFPGLVGVRPCAVGRVGAVSADSRSHIYPSNTGGDATTHDLPRVDRHR